MTRNRTALRSGSGTRVHFVHGHAFPGSRTRATDRSYERKGQNVYAGALLCSTTHDRGRKNPSLSVGSAAPGRRPDISSIDPRLDLEDEILRLKRQKNAVLLAHYYQEEAIQDLADFVGDSLDLSRKAQSSDATIIAFAGRPIHGRDRQDPESDPESRSAGLRGRLLARGLLSAGRLPGLARGRTREPCR